MNIGPFVPALAVAVALAAAFTDVKRRRIPNHLTYSALLSGFVLQSALHGWKGLLASAEGVLFFGGMFMLLYLVRAMGAGDVKLAAALGSIVAGSGTLPLMYATAAAGGALAIWSMVLSGRLVETLRNTCSVVGFHIQHGLQVHPVVNLDNPAAARMPYGVAFALGTVYWAVTSAWWR